MLKELSHLPDLILLDARMPIMDGYQFRIEQKRNSRLNEIPIVVMTGDDDMLLNERMQFPDGILVKPLNLTSLLERVAPYI